MSAGSDLAAEMLGEAANKGMKISADAEAVINETIAPREEQVRLNEEKAALEQREAPALPTPAEDVDGDMHDEATVKFAEMPVFAPVPDEEFAGFEEEEAEQTLSRLEEVLDDEEAFVDNEDELRAEVHKLRKALSHQKELRAKQQRSSWETEAKEKYPLANVTQIAGQSRNAFMKAAAQSHNANYNHLAPFIEKMEEYRKSVAEQAKAEGRKQAVEAWGKPSTAPSVGEVDESDYQRGLVEVRKTGSLEKVLRYMRESGR